MSYRVFVILFFLLAGSAMTLSAGQRRLIPATNPHIRYMGRTDHSKPDCVTFDWPGVVIDAFFTGSSIDIVIKGTARFDVFINESHIGVVESPCTKATVAVAHSLPASGGKRLRLAKRSESTIEPISLYGFMLDSGSRLLPIPEERKRKILFIGDSYTAGFANEHSGREFRPDAADSIIFTCTNANRSFGPLTAKQFDAQYQLIAISGKGLVRNYNGIDKGKELPAYIDRTLLTSVNNGASGYTWKDDRWKADVVVTGIGINDFQADPPYADPDTFDNAYDSLIQKLRVTHPGVKIICCATKVWPTNALVAAVKRVVTRQLACGHKDIRYFEYSTANGALYGHPSLDDHRHIADQLIPIIREMTGWR